MTTTARGGPKALTESELPAHDLAELARRHLWLHYSQMGSYSPESEIPVIVRGEGVHVVDARGKRYIDGLSSLFTSQLGHGNKELAEAARKQSEELAYFPLWTYAHPSAITLAAKLAELAPGDLNRVFFTTGGGDGVEAAWKLARQYHQLRGEGTRYKVISRDLAYHGSTLGALSITSLPSLRQPFEPLVPGAIKVPNTNFYRASVHASDEKSFGEWAANEIERAILREGPQSVALVLLEPVQNAGGCFVPPPGYFTRVREICDKYGVLLVSDEVICAFGRLGTWFGAQRYDYQPDMIITAKGLTSAYAPLGALIVSDKIVEPFLRGTTTYLHGLTFGGHPVSCAVALKSIEIIERDGVLANVEKVGPLLRQRLLELQKEFSIIGDVRGDGLFYAIELVKNQETRETFSGQQAEELLRGYLTGALYDRGLICRADDRGDPVLQLAPPLTSTPDDIECIISILRAVLRDAPNFL
jgi:adenosylmethionine-8-amino-7-oxononanoate aminotransferase